MIWSNLKAVRHHFIFIVFTILIAIFYAEGLWYSLFFFGYLFKRFALKAFYLLFVFFVSYFWLTLHQQVPEQFVPDTHIGQILSVKQSKDHKQTAVVLIDKQKVWLTYPHSDPLLLPGQTIQFQGDFQRPSDPTIPFAFSFKHYLYTQGIEWILYSSEITILTQHFSLKSFQVAAAHWVRNHYPSFTSQFILALFLGIRSDLDSETLMRFDQLNIIHLLAISGVHVHFLIRLLKKGSQWLNLNSRFSDGLCCLFSLFFIILTGASVAVLRAGGSVILNIINKQFKLGFSVCDLFSFLFLAHFIFQPLIVYDAAFQYSYWLSFMMLLTSKLFTSQTAAVKLIGSTALVLLAALPLTVFYQYEINLLSFFAQLLIGGLLLNIIMPLLLVVLCFPFLTFFSEWLLLGFEKLNEVTFPYLIFQRVYGHLSVSKVVLLLGIFLIGCFLYAKKKKLIYLGSIPLCYFIFLELNRLWLPYSSVTFLDVGQGDATAIISPYLTCTVVVDTGGDVKKIHDAQPSIFSRTLEPFLVGSGVRKIDYLILTHEHYDHLAEATLLMDRLPVGYLVISEAPMGAQMGAIVDHARRRGVQVIQAKPLDEFTCGGHRYTFVHDGTIYDDVNENSLVILVHINGLKTLLTGDMGHPTEEAVLAHVKEPVHIYQVAHHGSRFSNSQPFVTALSPHFAVVSAGRSNRYGHPHKETVQLLAQLGIKLYDTRTDGTVQFQLHDGKSRILTWPPK